MYSQAVVDQRLRSAREVLGFELEYHSVHEVEQFNSGLEQKYAEIYQAANVEAQGAKDANQAQHLYFLNHLTPKMSRDEIRWIENERALVACDAAYFLSRYYWIKNEQNIIQRFTFRNGQKVYFSVVSELEERGASIEMICGKARQLGISTVTEGLELQRICFTFGANAVIASADRVKTGLMSQMLFLGYDMLPWWMKPIYTRRVESDQGMLVFGGIRAGVSFQHGAQTSGIARGSTVTVFHLSEVASYQDAGMTIEDALFKCVHSSPKVLGTLESSFEGDTGWFYDTYWYAKREWKNNRSRLCAMFLPWFLGTELYPTKTWVHTRPVPKNWTPEPETRSMMARAKMYVASNPILEKVLGPNWKIGTEQAWFWEVNFLEHRAKGREKLWFQEMPTDDREAGQGSYDNVFGREVIAEVYSARKKEYNVYGIVGQSIESKHEPDTEDIDYSKPRIPVKWRSPRGEIFRWELIPLHWHEDWDRIEDLGDDDSFENKLFEFIPPEEGYDYSAGVDTSTGIGQECTVIAMARRARGMGEPDVQCAEFRSSTVSHVEAYPFVMVVAAYYSKHMERTTNYREPYVAIEQVQAVGDTTQLQMKKMGYSRMHRMTRYDSKTIKKSKATKQGWYTWNWSRPLLTDGFVIAVQNGWYVVNSPWTIWEMDHWEVHLTSRDKKTRFEHDSESTDDGIFANALATFCPNDLKTLTERTKKRCVDYEKGVTLPAIDLGTYSGRSFSPTGTHSTLNDYDPERDLLELLA